MTLSGAKNSATLRAGFAYIVAAACAQGETRIAGVEYIARGYADVLRKLGGVGCRIAGPLSDPATDFALLGPEGDASAARCTPPGRAG